MAVKDSHSPLLTLQTGSELRSLSNSASPSTSIKSLSSSSRMHNSTNDTTPDLSTASTTASKQSDPACDSAIAPLAHSDKTDPASHSIIQSVSLSTQIDPLNNSNIAPERSPASTIHKLKRSEIGQAAHSLAKAFEQDEMSKYFTHTPDRQYDDSKLWDVHLFIMKCIVRAHVQSGLATTIGDNYDCVALWMPPGKNMDGWWPSIFSGMNRVNFSRMLSKEGRKRFFDEFLSLLHTEKHAVLGEHDENSWYLVYIGTKPGSTGKGYASMLIEHKTKEADAQGLHCYLESSNVKNESLYKKLGFVHRKFIHFTRSTPKVTLDIMVREPKAIPNTPPQIDDHAVLEKAAF